MALVRLSLPYLTVKKEKSYNIFVGATLPAGRQAAGSPLRLSIFIVFEPDMMHEGFELFIRRKSTKFAGTTVAARYHGNFFVDQPIDEGKNRKA